METNKNMLEMALYYASMGMQVIPLKPNTKDAAISWKDGGLTDPDDIELYWGRNPSSNIGILTGERSGVDVIDFDSMDAYENAKTNGLPDGPTVKTYKGYHLYCIHVPGLRGFQNRKDMEAIDLRADGNYIAAPPSVHPNGTVYQWVAGKGLDGLDLPAVPEWIYVKNNDEKKSLKVLADGVEKGERNDALTRLVGSWIANGMKYEAVFEEAVKWNKMNTPPDELKVLTTTVMSIWNRHHERLAKTWDDPLPLNIDEPPVINADILPSWLGAYALAVSRNVQTPEALSVMVALGIVATCLQRKFVVLPHGTEDYKETLALWAITVLPPSERKSAIVSIMTDPFNKWEQEQAEALKERIIETRNTRAILNKKIEKLRKDAADAENNTEMATILDEIREVELNMPEEIYAPKLWASDITPERLQDMLVEQGEKMSLISDEAGIFNIMGGMYNKGTVNLDVFLQGYTGSSIRVERKGRPPANLNNPALSFCLTVQPKVIEEFSKGSKDSFRGKGLLARFLFCIPKPVLGTRNVRSSTPIPSDVKAAYERGIRRLLDIEQHEEPVALTFSDEARELWYDFWQTVEDAMAPDRELYELADWAGKLHGNVARIAGLLHIVENGGQSLTIGLESTRRAIHLGSLLIEHAKKAFNEMGISETYRKAMRLYKWIRDNKLKEFTKQKCQNNFGTLFKSADEVDAPVRMLEHHNIIREFTVGTGGRPSVVYKVNPKLLEMLG